MASGYRAAISIDRYLKGKDLYQDRAYRGAASVPTCPRRKKKRRSREAMKPRAQMPAMTADRRVCTFEEVNLGLMKRPPSARQSVACAAIWNTNER